MEGGLINVWIVIMEGVLVICLVENGILWGIICVGILDLVVGEGLVFEEWFFSFEEVYGVWEVFVMVVMNIVMFVI